MYVCVLTGAESEIYRHEVQGRQGRRHEVLIGMVGFIGTQTHLPPKFSFSSDFGHFILKMLENTKNERFNIKFTEICKFLWESTPAVFKSAGVLTPRPSPPPSATPLMRWSKVIASLSKHKIRNYGQFFRMTRCGRRLQHCNLYISLQRKKILQ